MKYQPCRYRLSFLYSCLGGAGGDGGNGKPGKSNLDKIPPNPSNAQEVYDMGTQADYTKSCWPCCITCNCCDMCGHHCSCCDEYWYHALDIITDACGGNGGNGAMEVLGLQLAALLPQETLILK